jgi:putative ABC transport system permease protein
LRWGRLLVAGQLALTLPLLAGAGLLARTLYNLRNSDLGYSRERLLVVRVDAQTAGYESARRAPLFQELLDRIRRVPGVRAATYSENGLFSGRDSGDQIEVEGYKPKGNKDRGSRWDQVGPGYFSTLGIPMIRGREIAESDHAAAPKVCVVNEAFARLFFDGRNPLGMHITTIFGDKRSVHEVIGVARSARTGRLRGEIEPRYYVPVTQPLAEMDGTIFSIRAAGDPGAALAGIRRAIQKTDATLPIIQAQTLQERLASRVAQDRIMARLAVAFALVAIALAAVGLYGVLSYGVARRRGEIGIRIALGAEPGRVVAMFLRETAWLIGAGLICGAGLAAAGSRLIRSQLYGLAPHDPAALATAVATLVAVAFVSAYLPSRRAARMGPMAALRE